jgi:colanic acid biosynthesis protein WcaH
MNPLPRDIFAAVVRHTPLVSIDLLLRDSKMRLLVGRRRNRPALDTWFVPGGRIGKDERIADAFQRIAASEVGMALEISQGAFVGVFEHIYADNALNEAGYGTHYVVLAYRVAIDGENLRLPRDQHSDYRWLTDAEALADPQVHENTKAYCR